MKNKKKIENFSACIVELLNRKYLAYKEDGGKTNKWTVTEDATGSKIKTLYISDCPKNVYIFQLQENIKFSNYFDPDKKIINKTCDIFIFKDNSCFVIDLKSDAPNPSDTLKQLDNSKLFIEYLNSISSRFFHNNLTQIQIGVIKTTPVLIPTINAKSSLKYKGYKEVHVKPDTNKVASISFKEILDCFD
jgi:hypothetical protein